MSYGIYCNGCNKYDSCPFLTNPGAYSASKPISVSIIIIILFFINFFSLYILSRDHKKKQETSGCCHMAMLGGNGFIKSIPTYVSKN